MLVPLDAIRIGKRLRGLREASVVGLTDSIKSMGLQVPISVSTGIKKRPGDADQVSFELVAGAHRLEACRRLGWEEIEATIVQMTDDQRLLWEIDENLCRADLTELERGEHLLKRQEVCRRMQPRSPAGQFGVSEEKSFLAETSEETRIPERTIQRAIQRAKRIDESLRPVVAALPSVADSGVELDALGRLDRMEQRKVINAISEGRVSTVREGIKRVINAPAPKPMFKNKLKVSQEWRASFMKLIAKAAPEDLDWAREQLAELPDERVAAALTVVK